MTLQTIGADTCRSVDDFLTRVHGLEIDQIVVVINHGKDFMTFGYECSDEFLDIALRTLQRYRNGDYTHIQEH